MLNELRDLIWEVIAEEISNLEEGRKAKLGSGARFKKLEKELKHDKGVKDPGALAAWIGRKKYGKKRFAKLSAGGKK